MAKRQIYSFVFNTPQSDANNAMRSVGSELHVMRDFTAENLIYGNISEPVYPSLSSDGITLRVVRVWTDAAYEELMTITTIQEIIDQINALDFVAVENYEFVDV